MMRKPSVFRAGGLVNVRNELREIEENKIAAAIAMNREIPTTSSLLFRAMEDAEKMLEKAVAPRNAPGARMAIISPAPMLSRPQPIAYATMKMDNPSSNAPERPKA